MWGRQVHSWSDCHLVIEDHAEHRSQEEGEVAMGYRVQDTDDEDQDSETTESFGGGDSDGDEGGEAGYQPPSAGNETPAEFPSGAAGCHGPAKEVAALMPATIADAGLRRAEFRQEMLGKAVAAGDDPMIPSLRKALEAEEKK